MTETTTVRPEVLADRQIAAAWSAYHVAYGRGEQCKKNAKHKREMADAFCKGSPRRMAEFLERANEFNAEAELWFKDAERLARQAQHLDNTLYRGWQRFFLVEHGHIHASTACRTLHPRTRVSWLPELSGLTEKDAVEAHGPLLCSVCFPSAPVEWTKSHDKPARCPGSGQYVPNPGRRLYVKCPVCGEAFSRTTTGMLRAHAPR